MNDIYDPLDPEHAIDPYGRYEQMRARCPVQRTESGFVVVAKDDDCRRVLRGPDVFSSLQNAVLVDMAEEELVLAQIDPPRHTLQRRMLAQAFSPGAMAAQEPFIRRCADDLLDSLPATGAVDLMATFASPLPGLVLARMIGLPEERLDDFTRWADDFIANSLFGLDAVKTWPEFSEYLIGEIEEHRRTPASERPDDLVTRLIGAEVDGQALSDVEIRTHVFFLIVAGIESTAYFLGNTVWQLLSHDLWSAVVENRALVAAAVEESLRFEPPVQWMMRTATGPTTIRDEAISKGDRLFVSFGSANRDEDRWTEPEQFRLDREGGRDHLAFGHGIHVCLGAPLARLEGRIALEALVGRYPNLRLSDDFAFSKVGAYMSRGLRHLPVERT